MSLASELGGMQVASKLEEDLKEAQVKMAQLEEQLAASAKDHAREKGTLPASLAAAEYVSRFGHHSPAKQRSLLRPFQNSSSSL